MNYIKSYKVFENIYPENQLSIKEHIHDIFSPVIEEGFNVKVDISYIEISIEISNNQLQSYHYDHNKSFYFEEVEDELHHSIKYLKEEGFNNITINYNRKVWGIGNPMRKTTKNLSDLEGEDITQMSIKFSK